MTRHAEKLRGVALAAAAVALAVAAAVAQSPSLALVGAADEAWDAGRYVAAIDAYLEVLHAADGDAFVERIAVQTGELYATRELTPDGRAPRFSQDGRLIAYEIGLDVSRATRVVRNDAALTPVADLPGVSAVFSPGGDRVAYLKLTDAPELTDALRALDVTPLAAGNRTHVVRELGWQILAHTSIAEYDVARGGERLIDTPGLLKTGLTYGPDGRTLYFLGATDGQSDRTDIYALAADATSPVVAVRAEGVKGIPVVPSRATPASGAVLLYVIPGANPFRRPGTPGPARPVTSFAVVDLVSGDVRTLEGVAPTVADSGSTIAYVARDRDASLLMVGPPFGDIAAIKRTVARLDAPALGPAAGRVAYQVMTRDDWEIYVADIDGGNEQRVTTDLQHDVLPRFIGPERLVAAIGEPRHRRLHLYDLRAQTRTRLFHNNTIRTIAPEYEWVPSDDGAELLIGAERDGDTVSPERGVYLVDLRRRIAKQALVERLDAVRAAEAAMLERGRRQFAPIGDEVRAVLARVSVDRVFAYERDLFAFGSKYISEPGNLQASTYLVEAFRSFGYAPDLQWLSPPGAHGGRTANVVATLRGTVDPDIVYIVSSHYDSVAGSPGADDDTSGTAALLEAARVLADHRLPATVVFASFTGEEAGLLGSREFVRRAVAGGLRVAGALNNDMIGWANDTRLDNTIRYSNAGIRDVQHAAAALFTRLVTYDAVYFKNTDAAAYYEAFGDIVGGIGSYPVLGSPHYHQPHDVLEFVNHDLVTETSKATVAAIMLLVSSPSRVAGLEAARAADGSVHVRWQPNPERGITGYRVAVGPPNDATTRIVTAEAPELMLTDVPSDTVLAVRAVNGRGLEGWDWARVTVP